MKKPKTQSEMDREFVRSVEGKQPIRNGRDLRELGGIAVGEEFVDTGFEAGETQKANPAPSRLQTGSTRVNYPAPGTIEEANNVARRNLEEGDWDDR